jgi:Transposase, Mutator family
MGATADGKKELIAIADGYRESEQSWKELLLDVHARGLDVEPSLAIGDGALGCWKAMRQVWGTTREQRCWVHKASNVLDKTPKGSQPKAKRMLHDISSLFHNQPTGCAGRSARPIGVTPAWSTSARDGEAICSRGGSLRSCSISHTCSPPCGTWSSIPCARG